MRYGRASGVVTAMAAIALASGTARVGAQMQADQFTPEYREVHRSYDEKHTPKIDAPDSVKRGQWFEVTVTVGAGSVHPSRRSEEHTSELQSQSNLVCRLLLEKKKKKTNKTQQI